ncbi:MAG: T9SS type A sorting domain-containing protein [Flavobacteriales bacterium]|nr:T9SS type A sorting domain-containing protein [Flavobacteriales bacterium]
MKLKYVTIIVLSLVISMMSITYENVEAKSAGAPASRTGAPTLFSTTEPTCKISGCHNTFDLDSGPGELTVELMNGWTGYQPGVATEVKVKITQTGFSKFGFEAVAMQNLGDLNKPQAGEIQLTDPLRTQLLEANGASGTAGRQYITHTFDGNVGENDASEWTFTWIPADTTVGEVGIYVTVVAANQDGDVTGDYVYTKTLLLAQAPLSVGESQKNLIKIYPTLVTDVLNVLSPEPTTITLYNLVGQKVYTKANAKSHNLSGLSAGQYIYVIGTDTEVLKTGKLIRK